MKQIIMCVYRSRQDAALAIIQLLDKGYNKKDISVLGKNKKELSMISHDTGLKKPESGNGNTGLFGEIKDMLTSIELRSEIIWVIGPAAVKLAGAEIGTVTDGLVVGLIGLGIPKEDAQKYEDFLMEDHIILMMVCERRDGRGIRAILEEHHAVAINK
ncbi:general stress protein [Paenibacillus dokdonensis]|uniref:general stress protein n=1 Tax=Paenibacillus dokdonensis TaxID=2567944 RepID=UPI001457E1B4|nr:general stress protein [Paenibacillus dokdonensis]